MKVCYDVNSKFSEFEVENSDKLNFVLSDHKGDFVNFGVCKTFDKYQGYFICDKSLKLFKTIDEFVFSDSMEFTQVKYNGFQIKRNFKNDSGDKFFDKFYFTSTNCLSYSTSFRDWVFVDLDCRSKDDFSTDGREYRIFEDGRFTIIEYVKENLDGSNYKIFLGMFGEDVEIEPVENWICKDYEYSKERGSNSEVYIYRGLKFRCPTNERVYFSSGFSKKEVIGNLEHIRRNGYEVFKEDKKYVSGILERDLNEFNFKSNDIELAYRLSSGAVDGFLSRFSDGSKLKFGSYAGFYWFSDVWGRDELASLNSLILLDYYDVVRDKILSYVREIEQSGLLRIIHKTGALESCDSLFWLSKRICDFISKLESEDRLNDVFSNDDLTFIFERLNFSFKKIFDNLFDYDEYLIRVKRGQSWMDTIDVEFPLDVQVQLLGFVSDMEKLCKYSAGKVPKNTFNVISDFLEQSIRNKYFRNGILYSEANFDRVSSNVFLAYYFCPELFSNIEWEGIFDSTLKVLKTSWGGISSLSFEHSDFSDVYLGESNLSYHNGDVWFWINCIAGIALSEVNSEKYFFEISQLIDTSVMDILVKGSIGFGSEISSAKEQRAEGCLAQLWSSAFFIEMIDKLFKV